MPNIYSSANVPIYPPYLNFSTIHVVICSLFVCTISWACTGITFIIGCDSLISTAALHASEKTKRMQRKYFQSLCIQLSIPLISHSLPWFYYAAIIATSQDFINQSLNNFFFSIMSSHGTVSSISLLTLTHPYRVFVLSQLRKIPFLKFCLAQKQKLHIAVASATLENTREVP
ncbi:unnamed protein product, partial [Mesorhabditis belari]|uniref:G protein-coupled receptor n=1 Tax=Mesorhabditis belari TaxID=2138241 RepID=A0AAF3F714_9BILA